jgi:hypothetical protein
MANASLNYLSKVSFDNNDYYSQVSNFVSNAYDRSKDTIRGLGRQAVGTLYPEINEAAAALEKYKQRASQLKERAKDSAPAAGIGVGAGAIGSLLSGGSPGRALYQGAATGLGAGLGYLGSRYATPALQGVLSDEYKDYANYLKYVLPAVGGGLGYMATRGKTAASNFNRPPAVEAPEGLLAYNARLKQEAKENLRQMNEEYSANLIRNLRNAEVPGTPMSAIRPNKADYHAGMRQLADEIGVSVPKYRRLSPKEIASRRYDIGRRRLLNNTRTFISDVKDVVGDVKDKAVAETLGRGDLYGTGPYISDAKREEIDDAIGQAANEKTFREQAAKADERLAKAKLKPESAKPPAKTEPAAKMPPLDKYQELTNLLALAGAGGVAGASLGGLVGYGDGNALGGATRGAIIGTSSGAGLGLGNTLANKIISGLPAESSPLTTNLLRLGLPAAGLGSGFYLSSALTKPKKSKKKKSD